MTNQPATNDIPAGARTVEILSMGTDDQGYQAYAFRDPDDAATMMSGFSQRTTEKMLFGTEDGPAAFQDSGIRNFSLKTDQNPGHDRLQAIRKNGLSGLRQLRSPALTQHWSLRMLNELEHPIYGIYQGKITRLYTDGFIADAMQGLINAAAQGDLKTQPQKDNYRLRIAPAANRCVTLVIRQQGLKTAGYKAIQPAADAPQAKQLPDDGPRGITRLEPGAGILDAARKHSAYKMQRLAAATRASIENGEPPELLAGTIRHISGGPLPMPNAITLARKCQKNFGQTTMDLGIVGTGLATPALPPTETA